MTRLACQIVGCTVAKKKGHHGTETHSKASKKDKKQNYKKESAISQSPAFTQVLKSQHNPIMKKQSTSQKSCSRTNFTTTFTHPLTFSTVRDHNPFQLSGEDKTTINPQPSTFFFLDYHHPSSLITSRHRSFFIVRPRLPSLIVRKRGLRYVAPSLFLKISIIFIVFSSPFSSLSFIVDCFFFHSDFSSTVS